MPSPNTTPATLSQLVAAHEAECEQFARRIHDDPLQRLNVVAIELQLAASSLEGEARAAIDKSIDHVRAAARSLGSVEADLSPHGLDMSELPGALRDLLTRHNEEATLTVAVDTMPGLPDETALALYRFVQRILLAPTTEHGLVSVDLDADATSSTLGVRVERNGGPSAPIVDAELLAELSWRSSAAGATFESDSDATGERLEVRVELNS
jgi:signal transduction histidine kinase